jgi:hypothetical protein
MKFTCFSAVKIIDRWCNQGFTEVLRAPVESAHKTVASIKQLCRRSQTSWPHAKDRV